MPKDVRGWGSVISSVKTELGLLALVLLVSGAFFTSVRLKSTYDLALVIKAFALIVLAVIALAGVLLFFRERRAQLDSLKQNQHFAKLLGEETFKAYGGSIGNLLPSEQKAAYRDFYDIMSSSRLFESATEKAFVQELIVTVRHNAEMKDKRDSKGDSPVRADPESGE